MKLFLKLLVLFLLFFSTTLNASQNETKQIAKISASSLYNIDKNSLQKTINAYVQSNQHLKALKVVEVLSGETYYKMYKINDDIFFDKEFPKDIEQHFKYTATSKYDNEAVGEVTAYFENKHAITLTNKEKQWLKKHPNITLGADASWQPFDFKDKNGKHAGFDADYLEILRQKLGIHIKVELGKWAELQDKVKNKQLAGLVGPTQTKEREKYMVFTKPYFNLLEIVLVKNNSASFNSLDELNGKTLAFKSGSSNIELFKTKYPQIKQKIYKNYSEIIRAVSFGEVYAGLTNVGAASYEMERNFISNLKVAMQFGQPSDMSFGIRKDWPELASILQKGIDAISNEELNKILEKWLKLAAKQSTEKKVLLTDKETTWIRKNPFIKIATMKDWEPFDIPTKDGKHIGFHTDLINLINKKVKTNLVLVPYESWKDAYEDVTTGKVYAITSLSHTKQREEKYFNYSDPYHFTPYQIIVSETSEISSIYDLSNKHIAIREKSIAKKIAEDSIKDPVLSFFPTVQDVYKNIQNGNTDATLIANIEQETLKKYGLKVVDEVMHKASEIHIGVNKNYKTLSAIINKAVKSISLDEMSELRQKWFVDYMTGTFAQYQNKIEISFTQKEKEFLKKHQKIRVHNEKNWPPFNFYEFEEPRGYSIDLMNIIAKNTGLNIEFITGPTWDRFLTMMKNKELDVMLNIVKSEERSKYMIFTDPFLNALNGIAIREDDNSIKSFQDIITKNKVIAVERGFYYHEYIEKNYPTLQMDLVDDGVEALRSLSYGSSDATIGMIPVMNYLSEKNYITNLKFFGDHREKLLNPIPIRLATRKDLPELQSILQKGLASITPNQYRELNSKWLGKDETQEDSLNISLTKEEKQWLQDHKEIKFTADPTYLPYEAFTEDGQYIGMASEYIKIIEDTLGIEFTKIDTSSWSESLEFAKEGKVDILSNYTIDESLKDIHISTKPYIKSPIAVFTKNDLKKLNNLNELSGKKIAVVKGYGYLEQIFKDYPKLQYVEVPNARVGMMGVSAGEYDAMICSLTIGIFKISEHGLHNLHIALQTNYAMELGLGIKKEWKPLVTIINKVIDSIPPGTSQEITQKWLGENTILTKKISLTKEEQVWLDKQKTLNYVYDVDWAPFEWKNELGEHTGIIRDILSLIEQRSGINFEQTDTNKWSDAVNMMKTDQADMYSGVGENPERKEYVNFTKNNIFKTPYVFVSRSNDKNDYLETFKVIENKKVAVVHDYTIHGMLKTNVPELPLLTVKNVQEGFDKVRSGELDIFIVNAATAKYYINRKGYEDLKIATKTEFNLELKIALQKKIDPIAINILDKAIESLEEKELSDLYFKWTEVQVETKINWTLIYEIAGGALVLLLLVGYWNRKLKKAVDDKTAELKMLLESFDDNVIASKTDTRGYITYASKEFARISGYEVKELIGKSQNVVRHPDMPKELFKELWETIKSGKTFRGEIKNKKKEGGFYWVHAVITPEYDKKGNLTGYSAIRQDITSKKEVEELSETLEQKVEKRTDELNNERKYINAIMNSQTNMVISSDGKCLRTANKAFMDFFGVKDTDDFIKQYGDCICDVFDTSEPEEFIQKMMGEEKWLDYVYARPNQIHKVKIVWNDKEHIFTITADKFSFNNQELKTAVFNDITEIEQIRKNIELIFSNILLPILITSKESRIILYANNYAQLQYEKPVEELIGSSIDEIYTFKGQHNHIIETIDKYGRAEGLEEIFRTATGKEFTALLSVTPIVYNNEDAYIGMVTDITKQKAIEEEIRSIHKHTRSSIEYASLIQHAIVPEDTSFNKYFNDFFTIWEPKDIVGGDIYLFEELRNDDECLVMVIDCTGHGVPGAFVTMLVKAIERQIAAIIASDETMEVSPAWILQYFNRTMKKLLKQENDKAISNAGFDGGVIYYNKKDNIIKYSGAETPLFYIEDYELKTIKGSRHSIGYKKSDSEFKFKEHTIELKEGMQFYLTTDGYLDQNGGEKGFPFGKKKFSAIINENMKNDFKTKKKQLLEKIKDYQGDEERNDDITVVGFKI